MKATELLGLSPEQIAEVKDKDLAALVSAAIARDREIKEATRWLETAKERLTHAAQEQLEMAGIKELEETSYIFNAEQPADGSCQVTFPGKQLVRGFFIRERDGLACQMKGKEMVVLGNLKKLAGEAWGKLFAGYWKPAKAFRELAQALLPAGKAQEIIGACEESCSPRVLFKTAEKN